MKDLRINPSHLDQIEHLLLHSMNGIHLLFDNETIARILRIPTEEQAFFEGRNLEKIQDLFTRFVEEKSLMEKHDFLARLNEDDYELLLRTYFYIVENSLFVADHERH